MVVELKLQIWLKRGFVVIPSYFERRSKETGETETEKKQVVESSCQLQLNAVPPDVARHSLGSATMAEVHLKLYGVCHLTAARRPSLTWPMLCLRYPTSNTY